MSILPNQSCFVFACGMERSGSSVYMRMITMLIRFTNMGRKIGDARLGTFEEVAPQIMAKARNSPGLKLIRTHDYHVPLFEREFMRDNAIGLYVWRDIRDVMVSYTLRESTDWTLDDEDIVIGHVKRIARNHEQWLKWSAVPAVKWTPVRVLVVTYPELINDKAAVLTKTALALGIRINESQARAAATLFEVDRMRDTMPSDHINDGRAGMWRDHITAAQANRLQEIVDAYAPEIQMDAATYTGLEHQGLRGGA